MYVCVCASACARMYIFVPTFVCLFVHWVSSD